MSDPDSLNLDQLASRTMRYADDLREVSRKFFGWEDPDSGQKYEGIKLQFENALDDALDALVTGYEDRGERPPAEDIRRARARQRVRRESRDLWDDYHQLDSLMRRMKRWLSDADSAIRAKQSVLKTEREMATHG